MQDGSPVLGARCSLRILVIQPWIAELAPIEASLRAAEIDAALVRVDFHAALTAALARDRFDLAILDPSTPDLPREVVEACVQASGRAIPLIVLGEPAAIGAQILRALAARVN
jgi:hypothetical protein